MADIMADTNAINLKFLAESQPSLCIPRVFMNVTEANIRSVFADIALGEISRVDIITRKTEKGENIKRVYIHFHKWFWNPEAQAARKKLVAGKEIKIVYDLPWYWKVSASKWQDPRDIHRRAGEPSVGASSKVKLILDETERPERPEFDRPSKRNTNIKPKPKPTPPPRRNIAPTLIRTPVVVKEEPAPAPVVVKEEPEDIQYKTSAVPPKKRVVGKKQPAELIIEEGEIVEELVDICDGLSEEDKAASQQLYGDL